jgi:CubicO group peptidase (beta-lactamase class C family)
VPSRKRSAPTLLTVALAAFAPILAVGAPPESNAAILKNWLSTYDAANHADLKAFTQQYLGNADIAYALDTREETGGFSLVKIQADEPLKLTALVRERLSRALWQVTMTRRGPGTFPLERLHYRPVPMSSQADALSALDAFATRLAAADHFSGVLAVSTKGRTVFAKAWGLADRVAKTPVSIDTPFLFASQGKMFTAVAVLQLIEAGKVSFDDPIGRYLIDYPNSEVAQKVTVRQLLAHTDGTGEMGLLEPQDGRNRAAVHSIADIIALNGTRGPAFEPGSQFEYKNYGYILLGALIEKVSGQSYYDYVQERVFRPAGMTHTGYPLREAMSGVAVGYTRGDSGGLRDSGDQLPWRGTPAGGGVSTAGDMQRFVAALNAGKLLSPTMLAEATKQQTRWYGYGFISVSDDGFRYWGHGGGAPGNSLVLGYRPANETSLICMSNRDPPICDRLAFNFLFRSPKGSEP